LSSAGRLRRHRRQNEGYSSYKRISQGPPSLPLIMLARKAKSPLLVFLACFEGLAMNWLLWMDWGFCPFNGYFVVCRVRL